MQASQEDQIINSRLKILQNSALQTYRQDNISSLQQWVLTQCFQQGSNIVIPRLSHLALIANIIGKNKVKAKELFSNQIFVQSFIKRANELYDIAFVVQQYLQQKQIKELQNRNIIDQIETKFGQIMDKANDMEQIFYVRQISLFISIKQAYPRQNPPTINSPVFLRQRIQSAKVYQYVFKTLFEKKNLKKYYSKITGLVWWLVIMSSPSLNLHFDLAKKINSFMLYHKNDQNIEMINICNTLFDLLSIRFPRDCSLTQQNLASIMVHLYKSNIKPFYELWLEYRIKFVDSIDFEGQLRLISSMGASGILLDIMNVLWDSLVKLKKFNVLLKIYSGFVRKQFLSLTMRYQDELPPYFHLIKLYMLGFANFERFQGEEIDQLTKNICFHATDKGMSLSGHYYSILQIYMTYENRFSCLSQSSKIFLSQIQKLNKGRLQISQIHNLYQKYTLRQMTWQEDMNLWQTGKVSNRYRGMVNLGNTCYINSFMQALFMTKKFRSLIHSISNDVDLPSNKSKLYALFNLFDELSFKQFGHLEAHRPQYFRSQLTEPFKSNHQQQDSAEFGRIYLQELSLELSASYKQKMEKLLFQKFTKEFICQRCKSVKKQDQLILDLIMHPDQKDSSICLSNLLQQYFKSETLANDNQLFCSKCKSKTDTISLLQPQRFADILIVTISLFQYHGQGIKILKPHNFEFVLKLNAILNQNKLDDYQLYAFIVHMGTLPNTGHYLCWARNLQENPMIWYCFDDGYVTQKQIKSSDEFGFGSSETPYILFYSRKNAQPPLSPLKRKQSQL